MNFGQACGPCRVSCSLIPGRGCFDDLPGDEIVVSPPPLIVKPLKRHSAYGWRELLEQVANSACGLLKPDYGGTTYSCPRVDSQTAHQSHSRMASSTMQLITHICSKGGAEKRGFLFAATQPIHTVSDLRYPGFERVVDVWLRSYFYGCIVQLVQELYSFLTSLWGLMGALSFCLLGKRCLLPRRLRQLLRF